MIKMLRLSSMSAEERALVMRRSEQDIADLLPLAQQVVAAIRERGDDAVVEYARKFDAPEFTAANLRVTAEQFKAAREAVPADVIAAIELAHDNIREFHEHQMPEPMWFTEVKPGIMAGEKVTPVTSVGLYVPRGKGAFPSVMLMLSVPAIVAGVKRVVVVSKPEPHRLLSEHLTSEYRVKTEGRGRTVDEWKLRVEGLDNHWLDCLVGAAVAASMQGAVLFGTDHKVSARPRLRLSQLRGDRR